MIEERNDGTVRTPLKGIRVVDFCQVYAGPFACSMLGTLGAEVIRIESESRLDTGRKTRRASSFHVLNHNKRGVTLNLIHPEAVKIAKKLIAMSDVVAENFRPGVMERLGLGYDELKKIKPDIIMLSLSALGDSGPERQYGALAVTFSGLAGLTHLTGYAEGPPTEYRGSSDFRSGSVATFATLAAIYHRQRTGQGQRIDLSAREALTCLIGDAMMDYSMNRRSRGRSANLDEAMAPHNAYRCAGDDHWVTIAVANDDEWSRLCEAMGQRALTDDPRFHEPDVRWRNQAELDEIITEWTKQRTDYEVMRILQSAGVAAMPCLRSDEICNDPHLEARGFLQRINHEEVGQVSMLNPPWKLSESPGFPASPGPMMGEDNDYVFRELLKMSPEEIQALTDEIAIY